MLWLNTSRSPHTAQSGTGDQASARASQELPGRLRCRHRLAPGATRPATQRNSVHHTRNTTRTSAAAMIQKLVSASSTPPRHNTHPAGHVPIDMRPAPGGQHGRNNGQPPGTESHESGAFGHYGNRYSSSIGSNLMPVSRALVTALTSRDENTISDVSLNRKRSSSGMFSSRRCSRSM